MELGLSDFRVRVRRGAGLIQVTEGQMPFVLENRLEVIGRVRPFFDEIYLDLDARKASL